MHMIRRAILALALIAGIAPAIAQVPPPVPALPDSERRTSYSLTASKCACTVNFALYGDSTDYQNWVEVFINGALVTFNDPVFGWTITSPTGALASIPRPVTDGVLTFNNAQTGVIQIVGARRPRRVSQFSENTGVPARNLNQVITDVVAMLREVWDKINDVTGRVVRAPPGETMATLPPAASRANQNVCFDSGGNLIPCVISGAGSSFSAGDSIKFTGSGPTTISAAYLAAGSSTQRNLSAKLFESTPSIIDYGGLGNNSQDNVAAFNTALTQIVVGTFGTGVPYAVTFPQGSFLFNSKPNADNFGVNIIGVNKSRTQLVRNYNEATASNGLINRVQGGGQVPNSGRLENLGIIAGTGTTGGSAISIIASDSPHGPDFLSMANLFVSYNGTGSYSGATLYIDGSAAVTSPQGSRDIKLHNVELFSNGWPSAILKTVVDFEWYGGNIAGLVTDVFTITGTSGNLTTGVNINVINMDAVEVDHAQSVHIRASSIQGAVTIDSTATAVFIESDQVIGGTITVNSTTSCVRSQITWTGSGCWVFQNLTITGIFDTNAINHATSVQVTNGAAAQAMNGKSFCATGVFANCGANSAGTMQAVVQTFASLTACGSTTKGSFASVSDSATVVWGATITGGGTNEVLANCNGSAWTVAGK